jgi:hypothetical protein
MEHKITDKLASITVTLQAGVPVFMKGEPGTGKSRFVEALGGALNRRVETLIGAMMCPEDVGGILNPSGDYIMPDWFRRLKSDGAGILFYRRTELCSSVTAGSAPAPGRGARAAQ